MSEGLSKFGSLAAITLLVTGCTTGAQRDVAATSAHAANPGEQKICNDAVYSSPEFDLLRAHLPMSFHAPPTLEQTLDQHFATDAEIKEMLIFHSKLEACRLTALQRLTTTQPTIAPIFRAADDKNANALTDLIEKKLTWGDYEVRLVKIRSEFDLAYADEERRANGR